MNQAYGCITLKEENLRIFQDNVDKDDIDAGSAISCFVARCIL